MENKIIKFERSLNPTEWDAENGFDNIYFERAEGQLPRQLLVEAKIIFSGDNWNAELMSVTDAAGDPVADELLSITDDTPTSLRSSLEQRALQIAFTDSTARTDQANYTSNLDTVIKKIQSNNDWHSLPATGEEWQPDADTKAAARTALIQLRSEMDGQEPNGLTLNHRIANRFNWDIRQRSDIPTGDWCWRTWIRILEEIDAAI